MRARVPYAVSVAVTTSTAAPRYSWFSTYFVPLGSVPDSLADEDAGRPPGQCALRVVEVDVQVVGPGNGGTGDLHGVLAVTEAVGQLGNPAVGALGRGGHHAGVGELDARHALGYVAGGLAAGGLHRGLGLPQRLVGPVADELGLGRRGQLERPVVQVGRGRAGRGVGERLAAA